MQSQRDDSWPRFQRGSGCKGRQVKEDDGYPRCSGAAETPTIAKWSVKDNEEALLQVTAFSTTLDLLRRPTEEIASEDYSARQKILRFSHAWCSPEDSSPATLEAAVWQPVTVGQHSMETDLGMLPACYQESSIG